MVEVAQMFGANKNIAKKDSNEVIDLILELAKVTNFILLSFYLHTGLFLTTYKKFKE